MKWILKCYEKCAIGCNKVEKWVEIGKIQVKNIILDKKQIKKHASENMLQHIILKEEKGYL